MALYEVEYLSYGGRVLKSNIEADDEDDAVDKAIMEDNGPEDDVMKVLSVWCIASDEDLS